MTGEPVDLDALYERYRIIAETSQRKLAAMCEDDPALQKFILNAYAPQSKEDFIAGYNRASDEGKARIQEIANSPIDSEGVSEWGKKFADDLVGKVDKKLGRG